MDALAWVEVAVFGTGLLMATIGALVMLIFSSMAKDVRRMADSVGELNTKVAVMIEKQDQQDKRITLLESKM